jgi:hypothetical protein
MKHIATISFHDASEQCGAAAIVRADEQRVAVALTLEKHGDIEVVMPRQAAEQLHAALGRAISKDFDAQSE